MKEEEVEVGGLQLAHAPLLHHLLPRDRDQGFFSVFIMLRPGFKIQSGPRTQPLLPVIPQKTTGQEGGDCLM